MTRLQNWPAIADEAAPFEELFVCADLGWADFSAPSRPVPMGRPRYQAAARDLLALLWEARCGRPVDGERLRRRVVELELDHGIWRDKRGEPRFAHAPPVADLARLAADRMPASGAVGPDLVLGPYADELDVSVPGHRRAAIASTAEMALVPPTIEEMSPFHEWCRAKPRPAFALRDALRPVEFAVPNVWDVVAQTPEGWILRDRLGVHLVPDAPVRVPEVGEVAGVLTVGSTLLARVCRTDAGWDAPIAFAVAGRPPDALLHKWLGLLLVEIRLCDRRASLESVLRVRGCELWRRVHEWAWHQQRHTVTAPGAP